MTLADDFLRRTGHVIFKLEGDTLISTGELPGWIREAFPEMNGQQSFVPEEFSFMDSFLDSLKDEWPREITRSQYWTTRVKDDEALSMQLIAFMTDKQRVVVVQRVDRAFSDAQVQQQMLLEGILERDGLLQLRDALVSQREEYRRLLDGIPDILFQLRSDGNCTGVRLGRVGGSMFSTSSFTPRPFAKFFPSDIEDEVSEALARCFRDVVIERVTFTSDDGVQQELRLLPTTSTEGVGILRDLD